MLVKRIPLNDRINKFKLQDNDLAIYNVTLKEYLYFLDEQLETTEYRELYLNDVLSIEFKDDPRLLPYVYYGDYIAYLDNNADFDYDSKIQKHRLYLSRNHKNTRTDDEVLLLYKVMFEPIAKLIERELI